ncbi:MAG: ABC transporter permease [Firmicutes bacterium]|nr:ABC transporter permease [Bacillota bacterium]
MKSIKGVFLKQLYDFLRQPTILISIILMPILALLMSFIIEPYDEGVSVGLGVVIMFAPMFLAFGPISVASNAIAEDIEYKRLRFLMMAGVKSWHYLAATIIFVMLISVVPILIFGFIGGFGFTDFLIFFAAMIFGSLVSIIVGATIGLISKSVQQAGSITIGAGMLLGMLPMLAAFNETFANIAQFLFTYQIGEIMMPGANILRAVLIIAANTVVFFGLFVWAFARQGLKRVPACTQVK